MAEENNGSKVTWRDLEGRLDCLRDEMNARFDRLDTMIREYQRDSATRYDLDAAVAERNRAFSRLERRVETVESNFSKLLIAFIVQVAGFILTTIVARVLGTI